jgi:uncharacterized protein
VNHSDWPGDTRPLWQRALDSQRESETQSAPRVSGKGKGFASISPERLRELARKGGKSAQARGTAHRFTPEEARIAGRTGGLARHAKMREA